MAVNQVAYENGPEIAYSRVLPQVRAVGLDKEVLSFPAILLPRTGLSKFIITSVILIIVICVGVGTGVGIEKHATQSESGVSASTTTTRLLSSTISTTTTTLSKSSPTTSPPIHKILNDTSVAAVTLTNGDQRLFFQDTSGAIRESIYNFAADQWEADTGNIIATDARNNTPIATFDIMSEPQSGNSDAWLNHEEVCQEPSLSPLRRRTEYLQIFMFYIIQNTILPIIPIGANETIASMQAFLVYENTHGNVSVINNINLWSLLDHPNQPTWEDIAEPLYDAYPGDGTINSIAAAASPAGFDSLNIVLVVDFDSRPSLPGAYIWSLFYNVTTDIWTRGISQAPDRSSFVPGEVDPELFDISQLTIFNSSNAVPYFYTTYINGTTLRLFPNDKPGGASELVPPVIALASIFPFAHLGSTTALNSTLVYLYHQLNDTAFAEEKYDTVGSFWTSSTIGLSLI
ncbi:hypothetical protein MMC17_005472 [Xylographa soralifera]|nr:hypothetical protein [Xylographa soralifera]